MDNKDIFFISALGAITGLFALREYLQYKNQCADIYNNTLNDHKDLLDNTIEDLQGLKTIIHQHKNIFKEIVKTTKYNGEEWKKKFINEINADRIDNIETYYQQLVIDYKNDSEDFNYNNIQ